MVSCPRPALARRAALVLALLAGAAGAASCGPHPDAGSGAADGTTIVLLGGRVLASSDRAATVLDEIAACSGAFGPSRFRVVAEDGARPEELAALLEGLPPARAVIAIAGDLGTLHHVDPDRRLPEPGVLSSRRIDGPAFDEALAAIEEAAAARGARTIFATAPLGQQGRVEVPELEAAARRVRSRDGPVLDLATAFRALERRALFVGGIDRLSARGHEALAREVFDAVIRQPELLPPLDEAEALARRTWVELRELAVHPQSPPDGDAELPEGSPSADPRQATRQAALAAVHRGMDARVRGLFEAITIAPGDDPDVPGLAVGRLLAGLDPGGARPTDPVERGLLDLFAALAARAPDSDEQARALAARHPHRLDAWMGVILAGQLSGGRPAVVREALATLARFSDAPVSAARSYELLHQWPASLAALPSVIVASRPFASLCPSGPQLEDALRLEQVGLLRPAADRLAVAVDRGGTPPCWQDELDRLEAAAGQ